MDSFKPQTETYEARVRESFAKQSMMATLGASLDEVRPGFCEISMPFSDRLTQQHGFIHAGALAAIIDSAGGYAAYTLFGDTDTVLTVEFKLNLMAPADGQLVIARGEVVRPGRSLTVTRGEVIVVKDGVEKTCAIMQQTMMRISGRTDITE